MTPDTVSKRRASRGPREPAEAHFRKLSRTVRSSHGRGAQTAAGKVAGRFEIYREDEVRMTSTRFGGGDWHWRLSDADGLVLLDTGGYPSEQACLQAVAILQQTAALARISRPG